MLSSLRIRNLALVEDLEWNLSPGFTAITGETGSGKSIIIGALKLLLGERAEKSLIRAEADHCAVEASFHLPDSGALNERLLAQGLDPCAEDELILKRVFSRAGGNKQFVNCCSTTLNVLKELGDSLVDLHGPHEHQSLLSPEKQMELLDSFAGATVLRGDYEAEFRALAGLRDLQAQLSTDEAALEREMDLLRHQVTEIEAAELQPGEEESLLARFNLASNGNRVMAFCMEALMRLADEDDSILLRMTQVQRSLREIQKLDIHSSEIADGFAAAQAMTEESARAIRTYADHLEIDPEKVTVLEERINLIETLKRKYGKNLGEILLFGQKAATRLEQIESRGGEIERLGREIAAGRERLSEKGKKLADKREKAAPKLAADVASQLRDLGFKKSGFDIQLNKVAEPLLRGFETVEFQFMPNPGEPPMPLRTIASSGEISRVMLAVKSSLASQDGIPLLVFDEIDANVGGEIAKAVGAKMKSLGGDHQVLCITHLPQVAGLAGTQFVVTKEFSNQRAFTRLARVEGEARVEEIARMLGGQSKSAVAHAKTLLSEGASELESGARGV